MSGSPSRQRSIVEIGRVVQVAGVAVRVELDIEHALRDDATITGSSRARVLDRVLEVEEDAWLSARVAFVDQHRPRRSRSRCRSRVRSIDGIQQWMAWAHKSRGRLALGRHERLLERNALVALKHGFADSDEAISIANRGRDAE